MPIVQFRSATAEIAPHAFPSIRAVEGFSSVPGATYAVTPGVWAGSPVPLLSHQWRVNGSEKPGETGMTYTPVPALNPGDVVTCRETATNIAGIASALSNALVVLAVSPSNLTPPGINATSEHSGATYTAVPGGWLGNPPPTLTGQWIVNGSPVPGATLSSFTPAPVLNPGATVRYQENATNPGGSASALSAIKTVQPDMPLLGVPPAISGSIPGPGATYSVTPGSWSGNPTPLISGNWLVDGTPVAAGPGNFTPSPVLNPGQIVGYRETAANTAGTTTAVANTINVGATAPSNTTPAVISASTPGPGATYTVTTPGVWAGAPAPAITQIWLVNGTPVSGETGASFTPSPALATGATVTCRETATNAGGAVDAPSNTLTVTTVSPSNTTPAVIVATTPGPGATYSVQTPGVWTGAPTPLITRQWQKNGANVSGQTGTSYTPSPALVPTDTVICRETATNSAGTANQNSNTLTVAATAPTTVAPISISGSIPGPGATYTATPGTWAGAPAPSLTRQWVKNGADVGGQTGLTYTPAPNLVNGDVVTCRETATNSAGSASANSNAITVTTTGVAPANTTPPSISGTSTGPGATYTATAGVWTGTPTPTITRAWLVNGTPVGGETGASFTPSPNLAPADTVVCRETASSTSGSASANSNTLTVLQAPISTSAPVISESIAGPGATYTLAPGSWSGSPVPTVAVAWLVNGSVVAGQTGLTFTPSPNLAPADTVQSRETATNSQGAVNATSNTLTVAAVLPANTVPPSIVGSIPGPGATYTVTPGTWTGNPTPIRFRQWRVNGANVAGQTGLTFTPVPDLLPGDDVACRDGATNSAGTVTVTSNHIIVGAAVPVNTVAPSISASTTAPGATYTATAGTWTGSPTPSITRAWLVNGGVVSGQTGLTFTPSPLLAPGDTVQFRETATNTAGSANGSSNTLTVSATAPANTLPPVIDANSPKPGAAYSLTAAGSWTGSPTPTKTYQWKVNGTNKAGATSTTYTPSPNLVHGDIVTVQETATNSAGAVSVLSNEMSVVGGALSDEVSTAYIIDELSGSFIRDELTTT